MQVPDLEGYIWKKKRVYTWEVGIKIALCLPSIFFFINSLELSTGLAGNNVFLVTEDTTGPLWLLTKERSKGRVFCGCAQAQLKSGLALVGSGHKGPGKASPSGQVHCGAGREKPCLRFPTEFAFLQWDLRQSSCGLYEKGISLN